MSDPLSTPPAGTPPLPSSSPASSGGVQKLKNRGSWYSWERSYLALDGGKVIVKELNIFKRIARQLGAYEETSLNYLKENRIKITNLTDFYCLINNVTNTPLKLSNQIKTLVSVVNKILGFETETSAQTLQAVCRRFRGAKSVKEKQEILGKLENKDLMSVMLMQSSFLRRIHGVKDDKAMNGKFSETAFFQELNKRFTKDNIGQFASAFIKQGPPGFSPGAVLSSQQDWLMRIGGWGESKKKNINAPLFLQFVREVQLRALILDDKALNPEAINIEFQEFRKLSNDGFVSIMLQTSATDRHIYFQNNRAAICLELQRRLPDDMNNLITAFGMEKNAGQLSSSELLSSKQGWLEIIENYKSEQGEPFDREFIKGIQLKLREEDDAFVFHMLKTPVDDGPDFQGKSAAICQKLEQRIQKNNDFLVESFGTKTINGLSAKELHTRKQDWLENIKNHNLIKQLPSISRFIEGVQLKLKEEEDAISTKRLLCNPQELGNNTFIDIMLKIPLSSEHPYSKYDRDVICKELGRRLEDTKKGNDNMEKLVGAFVAQQGDLSPDELFLRKQDWLILISNYSEYHKIPLSFEFIEKVGQISPDLAQKFEDEAIINDDLLKLKELEGLPFIMEILKTSSTSKYPLTKFRREAICRDLEQRLTADNIESFVKAFKVQALRVGEAQRGQNWADIIVEYAKNKNSEVLLGFRNRYKQ